jgi:hypothetical protein
MASEISCYWPEMIIATPTSYLTSIEVTIYIMAGYLRQIFHQTATILPIVD